MFHLVFHKEYLWALHPKSEFGIQACSNVHFVWKPRVTWQGHQLRGNEDEAAQQQECVSLAHSLYRISYWAGGEDGINVNYLVDGGRAAPT